MAYVYKGIKPSDITINPIKVHRQFNLNTGSDGISSIQFRSGSYDNSSLNDLSVESEHWHFLMMNFYLSGSSKSTNETKYNYPFYSFGIHNTTNPQHKNKFHSSGSIIYIPQQYIGEEIKRNSFTLVDSSNAGGSITIKDDGYGNLYPVNHTISQSATTSVSSSDNYVGNIFYNLGVVVITETGSYSSSVRYPNVGTNYTLQFDSTQQIYTKEFTLRVEPNEFNYTNNPTSRAFRSGSVGQFVSSVSKSQSGILQPNLTASGWSPHMNTIGFYRKDEHNPVMIARYPQPIKLRDDMTLIFKIRQDF
jgi:hypothetical protein